MPVHGVQEGTGIQCEAIQGSTPARQGMGRSAKKGMCGDVYSSNCNSSTTAHSSSQLSEDTAL